MAVSYTTTYNLTKPEVGASEDQWGGLLNDNLDDLDNLLDGTTPVTGIDINSGTIDGTVIGGSTPAAGTFTALTSNGIDDNASATAMTLDASGNVGIGTSSPDTLMEMVGTDAKLTIRDPSGSTATALATLRLAESGASDTLGSYWDITGKDTGWNLAFTHNSSGEAMRIDSSGNLLVGTTTVGIASGTAQGINVLGQFGAIEASRPNNASLYLNRVSSDGAIAVFRKDGTSMGSIGAQGNYLHLEGSTAGAYGLKFVGSSYIRPSKNGGALSDNELDFGTTSARWDDIYATNGTIQTSDRNEKQDIEALSDAEKRVAVACKGLLRKFRWKDAVAEKGDNARIHFGIIAQDLQDAFAAEGLDAGRYAMFISSTWWETQTDVPAVEAVAEVLDEDGNVVTEAVEAKEAYTRTDTYETLEEAPEGATERTRLGVRYPELLAFIIAAI